MAPGPSGLTSPATSSARTATASISGIRIRLDLPVVGALIAPRPLMIVNASKDGAFRPQATNPCMHCLRPVYEWYGARTSCGEYAEVTGHVDTPPYRKAADEWLNRWLRNDRTPFDESGIVKEDASHGSPCSTSYPADAANEGIHRSFVPACAASRVGDDGGMEQAPAGTDRPRLRDKVFGAAPKENVPFDGVEGQSTELMDQPVRGFLQRGVQHRRERSRARPTLCSARWQALASRADLRERRRKTSSTRWTTTCLLSAFTTHVVLVLNPRAVDYPMDNFRAAIHDDDGAAGRNHRVDAGVGYSPLDRLPDSSKRSGLQEDLRVRAQADGRARRCTRRHWTAGSPA